MASFLLEWRLHCNIGLVASMVCVMVVAVMRRLDAGSQAEKRSCA